jgi:transposase
MIGSIERRLIVQHRANEASKRLESIHGIGITGASAIADTVTDPSAFRGRVAILPPGLGWYRDKIQQGANRSLGRSRNRATAICGVFLWSGAASVRFMNCKG